MPPYPDMPGGGGDRRGRRRRPRGRPQWRQSHAARVMRGGLATVFCQPRGRDDIGKGLQITDEDLQNQPQTFLLNRDPSNARGDFRAAETDPACPLRGARNQPTHRDQHTPPDRCLLDLIKPNYLMAPLHGTGQASQWTATVGATLGRARGRPPPPAEGPVVTTRVCYSRETATL